jgi:hypothetical protein
MKSIINLKRIVMVAIWATSLILVGNYGHTQTLKQPVNSSNYSTLISGTDLGFGLQMVQNGKAIGVWVVKVDGAWIPVGSVATLQPAGH